MGELESDLVQTDLAEPVGETGIWFPCLYRVSHELTQPHAAHVWAVRESSGTQSNHGKT